MDGEIITVFFSRRNKRKPPTVSNPSDIIGDLESRRTSNVGDMSSTYIYTSVDSARSKPDKPAQIYAIYDSSLSRPAQLVHQQKADEEEMVEPIETLTPLRSASVRSNMVEKNNNNNKEGNMTEFYGYPMELVAKPMTRVLLVQNRLAPESLYILPFDKVDSSNGSRPLDPIKQAEKERDERPAGHQSSSTGDTGLYLAAVSVPKRQNQPEVPPPAIPRLTTTARPIEPQLGPLTLDVDTGSQTSLPSRASDVNSRLKEIGVVKPVRNHHYKDLREIRPPIVQRNGSNNDRTNESILISDHILPSTSENPSQIETTTSPSQQRRQIHVRDLQEEIINSPLFQKLRRKYGDADSNAVTNVIDTEAPTVRISTTRRTRIPLPPPPLPPARQSPQTAQPTSSKPSPPLKESVRNGPTKDNRNLRIVRSEISPTQQERIYQNPGYSPTLMSSKPSGTYNNLPAKPESPDVHNFGRKSLRVADDTALQQHMRPSDIRDLVYLPRIRGSPDRKLRSHQHKASSIDSLIDLAESPEFVYSSGHQSDYPFGHYTAAADDQISLNGVETQESDGSLSEDEFRLQRQGFISEALVNGRGLVSPKTAQHPVVTHSPLYSTDRPSRSESRPNHLRRVGNGENLSRENGYNNDSFVSDSGSENESPLVYTNNLRRHSLNEHHRSHHNGNSVPVGGSYRQRRSQDGNGRSMRDTAVIYDGPVRRTSKRRHRQSAVEGIPLELVAETRPYGNETVDILNGTDSRNEFNSRLVTGRGDVLDLDPLADFSDQWGMVGRRKPASKSASSFPDLSDSYRSDGAIWDSKPLRGRSKRVQFKDEVDQFEPDNSRKSGRKKINK